MLRVTLATLHLLALGIGLGAIWARARALSAQSFDVTAAHRAFTADNWWGWAAALWITTGLWRLLAGTEKASSYYMHNRVFLAKMTLFAIVLFLEIAPMLTLIRWRKLARREGAAWRPDGAVAARLGLVSYAEAALIVAIVATAVAMARGYGFR